ncbi:MAG: hypothetical protein O3A46_03915 [Candidatus Poribacteria bacterium]|nr:hypothetical protein [Candidatus Poribacteria bacterium]
MSTHVAESNATTALREEVRRAVDHVSNEDLRVALWMLEYLAGGAHPAKRAFQEAGADDPTADEIAVLDEYERRLAADECEWTSQEDVERMFREKSA